MAMKDRAARKGRRRTSGYGVMISCVTLAAVAALLLLPTDAGAVVGGTKAQPGEFPFVATAYPRDCTASLISPTWILTAAHCHKDAQVMRIGSNRWIDGGELIVVKRNIANPNYVPVSGSVSPNDLRLIELEHPAAEAPVALARPDQPSLEAPGVLATMAGYGDTCSPFDINNPACLNFDLNKASFPIISGSACGTTPQPYYATFDASIMICTMFPGGGSSPCRGDSGGPLFVVDNGRNVQVGAVQGGEEPCGDFPAVYTRVSAFLPWISDVTGIDFNGPTTTTTTTRSSTTTSSTPTTTATAAPSVVAVPRFTG